MKTRNLPPPTVRKEPPTLEEAAFAAIGLAEDLEQQIDIAAGLMDVSPDEVRSHVVKARAPRPGAALGRSTNHLTIRDRVVTVERTNVRRVVLPPRGARALG